MACLLASRGTALATSFWRELDTHPRSAKWRESFWGTSLPSQYASQQAAAGVGNADACLIFIRPPPGDQELLRMPKSFCIGKERVHISRPRQRGLLTPHTQPATADGQVVTHRGGPRSITIRQREQRPARRTATAEPTVAASTAAAPAAGTGHPGQLRPASAVRQFPVPVDGAPVSLAGQRLRGPVVPGHLVGAPVRMTGVPALGPLAVQSCGS